MMKKFQKALINIESFIYLIGIVQIMVKIIENLLV